MSGRKACHLTETDALTSWQWWKQVSGTRHTPRDKHTPSHIQDPCKFYKHIKPWKLKHRLILTICEPSVANTVHHIYHLWPHPIHMTREWEHDNKLYIIIGNDLHFFLSIDFLLLDCNFQLFQIQNMYNCSSNYIICAGQYYFSTSVI